MGVGVGVRERGRERERERERDPRERVSKVSQVNIVKKFDSSV